MNGELAQLIAFVAHGTAALRGDPGESDLGAEHSTLKYVGELSFRGSRTGEATSAGQWWRQLRGSSVQELRLVDVPAPRGPGWVAPHNASAFSNSGTWTIIATGPGALQAWRARWRVIDPRPAGNRIWNVVYIDGPVDGLPLLPTTTIAEARAGLVSALEPIRAFAALHVERWEPWFAAALALVDAPETPPPYHPDLLPPSASLERRQLMTMVIQSWVFGGMGSWNDNSFADEALRITFDSTTAELYRAVCAAAAVAANTD